MIFALTDYLQYKFRRGRYGDKRSKNPMALGFAGKIPADVIDKLQDGDMIFTQKMDSIFSWGVMYFGSSPVDHVGMYAGDGTILHMTLKGSRRHPLWVLGRATRILPVRLDYEKARRDQAAADRQSEPPSEILVRRKRPSHMLPPKFQMIWVAIRVVFGFHPDKFRWKFVLDSCLLFITPWIFIRDSFSFTGGIAMVLALLSIALSNQIRFSIKRLKRQSIELLSHPDIGFRFFFRNGGLMFTPVGVLDVSRFGLLPADVASRLRRQRANNGTDNQFEKTGQFGGDVVEDFNSEIMSRKTKNQN